MASSPPLIAETIPRGAMRRRGGRPARGGNRFVVLRCREGIARAVADVDPGQLTRLVENPDGILRASLDRPVKLGHGSQVVEAEFAMRDRGVHVAFKRYRPRNAWKAFCSLFRLGRARRSWRGGQILLRNHIPTPRPLAVVECHGWRRRGVSYLVSEWIEGAENLHLFGWRIAAEGPADRLHIAAACAEELGRMIGRMHNANISHGDLKAANILVRFSEDTLSTYIIDADDVCVHRRLDGRKQLADLARLATGLTAHAWVSRSVCMRFVRSYAGQFPPGQIDWKTLWREIVERSGRVSRKMQRRGERIL